MVDHDSFRHALRLFAELLEYPTSALLERAREAEALVSESNPQAAGHLRLFRQSVEGMSLNQLEETYTNTFDLQAVCHPYAGYHLFGESYKRGAFLAKLNEEYRARGYTVEKELPDHLPVILHFLATVREPDVSRVLLRDCLVPALTKMAAAFPDTGNPYGNLLHAVLMTLRAEVDETSPVAWQARKRSVQ